MASAYISIHAPRTGSDRAVLSQNRVCSVFQSTLPARGATKAGGRTCATRYFNPRSPHGERLGTHGRGFHAIQFQSTLPARGATNIWVFGSNSRLHFNPRSPHGERQLAASHPRDTVHFNPRSPHGERQRRTIRNNVVCRYFNPRSPHGERRC